MTREEAKELLPIIKAFAEGKIIEFHDILLGWTEVNKPLFNSFPANYRIKSEPKYRPFKTKEECWNEMQKHQPFGWLKNKESGTAALIGYIHDGYDGKDVWMVWATNENNGCSAFDLFKCYVFADGTPFGIKED